MAHMPKKQHPLLNDLDQVKKEYIEHNENVLNKFVTILGGIVENNLSKTIAGTDFDERGKEHVSDLPTCCIFLEGVSTNTKRMHQVLAAFLSPDHLRDVFSRIFAYIDTKVPALLISASESDEHKFSFPSTDKGKQRLLLEVQTMIDMLNGLDGVFPWEFTAVKELGRQIEYQWEHPDVESTPFDSLDQSTATAVGNSEEETPESVNEANFLEKEIPELANETTEELLSALEEVTPETTSNSLSDGHIPTEAA